MSYVDLTHRIEDAMPVFPGDPHITITASATFSANNNLGHQLTMGTHTGTHIDAPAHMLQLGKTLDEYSPDNFIGRGRYVTTPDPVIDVEVLRAASIEQGDVVIIDTGLATQFGSETYYQNYPVLSGAAADYLMDMNVKMVGIDTCSFDLDAAFPIHKKLLGHDILLIENLTNLQSLAGKSFRVIALPIRLNVDGAPARVIAEMN